MEAGWKVFPAKSKMANVVPIHKQDCKQNVKNYPPVSLLPFLEKHLNVLYIQ